MIIHLTRFSSIWSAQRKDVTIHRTSPGIYVLRITRFYARQTNCTNSLAVDLVEQPAQIIQRGTPSPSNRGCTRRLFQNLQWDKIGIRTRAHRVDQASNTIHTRVLSLIGLRSDWKSMAWKHLISLFAGQKRRHKSLQLWEIECSSSSLPSSRIFWSSVLFDWLYEILHQRRAFASRNIVSRWECKFTR